MTIKKLSQRPNKNKVVIDTTAPEGNAFAIMATVKKLNKQLNLGYDMNKIIYDEMMGGDYDNLLDIVEKYFGDFVIIYR